MIISILHPPSKRYETVEEILREFFDLRLKMYEKRKAFMVGWVYPAQGIYGPCLAGGDDGRGGGEAFKPGSLHLGKV